MKKVIKTIRWQSSAWFPSRINERVFEVYPTDSGILIKTFKRRKHARKFAKR